MQTIKTFNSFSGKVYYYTHASIVCDSTMTFAAYLPKKAEQEKLPAVIWLSGLTCNHENFITKAGAQRYADKYGLILLMPDTSPRAVNIQGADVDYDLGYGAAFYVNATQAPWNKNFRMYSYIIDDFIPLCVKHLPIDASRLSIMGHSMGGHGAIVLGLRNPSLFQSISAFSPIANPMQCPWGEKAFAAYLGDNQSLWKEYDSTELVATCGTKLPLRIDQGGADEFLEKELKPELLLAACEKNHYSLDYKLHEGFDHSYYFIATFIGNQLAFHAKHLKINC